MFEKKLSKQRDKPEEGRRPSSSHGDDARSVTPDPTAGRSPMDELGDIARGLGFLPQRKSPPMAASRSKTDAAASTTSSSSPNPNNIRPPTAPPFPDHCSGFPDDIFGPRPTNASSNKADEDDTGYDIFRGIPDVKFGDASPFSSATDTNAHSSASYDDLLGGFATEKPAVRVDSFENSRADGDYSGLEDLLPGFGVATTENKRRNEEKNDNMVPPFTVYSDNSKPAASEDPFVFLESVTSSRYHSTESLDDKNDSSISDFRKTDSSSSRGEIFYEVDDFDGFVNIKLKSSGGGGESEDSLHASRASTEPSYRNKESGSTLFDIPTSVSDSHFSANGSNFFDTSSEFVETNANVGVPSRSNGTIENLEGIWLDVTEVPLFTQLTCSPPPARPPPKAPLSNIAMTGEKDSFYSDKNPPNSAIDDLEGYAFGSYPRSPGDGWSKMPTSKEDFEENYTTAAYAAAVKDDICKMEKKSKHANEQMESEKDSEADKSRKFTPIREDGKNHNDKYERDNRNRRMQLERDQREKEVKEKARMKFVRDREEREKERRAVEIVTREARERAATDARLRAERAAAQKASAEAPKRAEVEARDKALAEARERAVAREKVLAEARERTETREKASAVAREMAAVKGRGRVEKTAAEAKERADRERRARERAAFERAATEARIRAQAEARDKAAAAAAAAAAKERHQKNESFFGMNARPNSAPKQRTTCDSFDPQFQTNGSNAASNMRKASSAANILDDLNSDFEDKFKTARAFQEIDGESEGRRKARYDRHLRTCERTAKALAEKNERDIQTQKEQEERHRIADTLDVQIKRWAYGKEGNLRALLSSLQYVLWPECGWQPVPLTDVITAASVKKVYRKATLCIHPDKVQQKGATLEQKYIAEKVFDLLKEAWNKFNSEELF